MAIEIISNFEVPEVKTPEEPKAETAPEVTPAAKAAPESTEEKKTDKAEDTPGGETPADGDLEPEPETENEAQEEDKAAEAEPKGEDKPKKVKRGGFQAQIEKLRNRNLQLQEELRKRSAEPAAEVKTEQKAELVRPVRPTLASLDYDNDKYEEAMSEYETKLEAYNDARSEKKAQEVIARENEAREKREQEAAQAREAEQFNERMTAGIASLPDFDDVTASLMTADGSDWKLPQSVKAVIFRSSSPAEMLYRLASNPQKVKEIAAMRDPFSQAMAAKELEFELRKQVAVATEPVKHAVKEAPKPAATPVKQQPRVVPAPPVTPLGSGAVASKPNLGTAVSMADYIKLRQQGVNTA